MKKTIPIYKHNVLLNRQFPILLGILVLLVLGSLLIAWIMTPQDVWKTPVELMQRRLPVEPQNGEPLSESDRREAESLMRYAIILVEHGDLAGASERLNSVLIFEPNNVNALLLQGRIHATLQKFPEAEFFIGRAAKVAPNNVDALVCYADILMDVGKPSKAEEPLLYAHELAPESAAILLRLGRLYSALGKTDQAVDFLRKAAPGFGSEMAAILLDKQFDDIRSEPAVRQIIEEKEQAGNATETDTK